MGIGENPYQPPVAPAPLMPAPATVPAVEGGVWRKGKLLVMHKRVSLPPRCVKTNRPAEMWLKRNLSWHPPILIITVLAGVMIYVILALLLRKTAKLQIGLTREQFARRRMHQFIMWGLILTSFAMIGGALALNQTLGKATPIAALAGFVLLIGAAIYGQLATRMVAPTKIDDNYVWLSGVCREYLDMLPEWPYR
ncbi:MAG: hypothetical protein RIC55_22760 [Pirellulaceae bacterium]